MPRTINQYVFYSFKDHDPIIDHMRTIFADEKVSYTDVHERSGVSVGTFHNWFNGKTKRPQYATVMAAARSLGYDMVLTKHDKVLKFKRNIHRAA
jgi:transcriptional regulator with XRE-family HTH domain